MYPASKAKSKDKKAGKDQHKNSFRTSMLANVASGTPVSGYNPLLGKFYTVEAAPLSSASSPQVNGRFRNIDESDDFSGSSGGNGMECDTLSYNGSWSGESEDHKDKTSSLYHEAIQGVDSDKRNKIRQKNEKKHQRQKERRALELHERCNGFLMSRKLEALAQQLVVMGFPLERATMALILNEGKIEQSIAWLFEGGEEAADTLIEHCNLDGGNLKIDISYELACIADMEIRYKCSRQDVERVIITCEGDLETAANTLRVQKQHPPSASQKPDETDDPPMPTNDKLSLSNSNNSLGMQPKIIPSTLQQQKKDDMVFNSTKTVATNGVVAGEPGTKNGHGLKNLQSKAERLKSQQTVSHAAVTNPPLSISLSSSQATPLPAKTEARYTALGNEMKNLQLESVKEPVKVMQRPESENMKQVWTTSISSSPTNTAAPSGGWFQNNVELVKPNGLPNMVPCSRSLASQNNLSSSNQLYSQHQQPHYVFNNGMMDFQGASGGNGLWSRMGSGSSPTLAVASSLGLFTGLGSNISPVDWKTGSSRVELDYANIDWSLDCSSGPTSGVWMPNNVHGYDAYSSEVGARTLLPSAMANGGGGGIMHAGFRDAGEVVASSGEISSGGARGWSSPLEEKEIFSLPWKFVTYPLL